MPCVCGLSLLALFLSTTLLFAQWPANPHTISLGKGTISEIGLSPDDGVLRITTSAGVWLHDPRTLQLRHLLETVDFSRFSNDGRYLAGALADSSIVVWDVVSGRVVTRIRTRFTDRLTEVAFDLPGVRIAAGSRAGEMAVWEVTAGAEVARMQAEEVRELVFDHPENRLVSANGYRAIRVWDLATSREIALLSGHEDNVRALTLHPSGRWLASGSIDFTVRIWDLDSLQPVHVLRPDGQTFGLEFDSSGRFLAARPLTSQRNGLVFYSVPDFTEVLNLEQGSPVGFINGGDGYVSYEPESGDIRIRDTTTWSPIDSIATGEHGTVDVTLDGQQLITRTDEGVFLYSVNQRRPRIQLPGFNGPLRAIAFQPGGDLVAVGSGHPITLWDTGSLQPVAQAELTSSVDRILFTADGQLLVVEHVDSFLWKIAVGDSLVLDPEGPLPGNVRRLWPARQLPDVVAEVVERQRRERAHLESARLGPQRRYLAVGYELGEVIGEDWGSRAGLVMLWDLSAGTAVGVLEGARDRILDLAFHPSGDFLATSGEASDSFIRLWDLRSMSQIDSLAVDRPPGWDLAYHPTREVIALGYTPAFSPSGQLLASPVPPLLWTDPFALGAATDTPRFAGEKPAWDGQPGLSLWDGDTFLQRATLPGRASDVAFNSAGDVLGTVNGEGAFFLHGAIDSAATDDLYAPIVLYSDDEAPTYIEEDGERENSSASASLSLWPNPFVGAIAIDVGGASDPVDLTVYDVLGRRVRTLTMGTSSAGLVWRGMDDHGRPVANGVYFVRLRHSGGIRMQRIMKVR